VGHEQTRGIMGDRSIGGCNYQSMDIGVYYAGKREETG
jgi:hypothetical protein